MANKQSSPSLPLSAAILSLPEELLVEILSRTPLETLPSLLLVCRRIAGILRHPNFLRRRLVPTLHVFNFFHCGDLLCSSTHLNTKISNWSPSVRRPMFWSDYFLVPLGRFIYLIGPHRAYKFDTWSKTATNAPLIPVRHTIIAAAAVNGKIYITGGRIPDLDEYDPATGKTRAVSKVPTLRDELIGAGAAGIFYIIDTLRPGSVDAYDVCAGEWLRDTPAPLPCGGCVVGACATPSGHVYIIVSQEESVSLSFWRLEVRGKEWSRLEDPVVRVRRGLVCRSVWFSCVAVGDDRVMAIASVSPRIEGGGWIGRDILVYNVAGGQWTCGPDLPLEFHYKPFLALTQY